MKYVTTKSNQTNFSQQELQFLNNFSSINDLYAFSGAVDKVVVKVDDLQRANPYLFYSLAGGLSGAGLGAIGGLMVGDNKKSKLRRMLEGGLIGGGLGAGVGALGSAYLKHKREQEAANKEKAPLLVVDPSKPNKEKAPLLVVDSSKPNKEKAPFLVVSPIKK